MPRLAREGSVRTETPHAARTDGAAISASGRWGQTARAPNLKPSSWGWSDAKASGQGLEGRGRAARGLAESRRRTGRGCL